MGKRRTIFWTEWFRRSVGHLPSSPEMSEMLLVVIRHLELEAGSNPRLGRTALRMQTVPSLDERSLDLRLYYRISPDDESVWLMWIESKGMEAESGQRLQAELDAVSLDDSDSPLDGLSH